MRGVLHNTENALLQSFKLIPVSTVIDIFVCTISKSIDNRSSREACECLKRGLVKVSEKIVEHGLPGKFDYLEHTSDIYIVAYGSNLLELFENAGLALFESMTDTLRVKPVIERTVEAEGFDMENLLYKWLEELLIIYYSERIMCSEVLVDELSISRVGGEYLYKIRGKCRGEVFNPEVHEPRVEVKAVTYYLMRIIKNEDQWRAYFVLDI